MRYLKLFALVGVLGVSLLAASGANAQRVAIGVGIGGPGYYGGYYGPAPICDYGYYNYYPYACAPYGYYGPEWFDGGFFIGAGPWFRGFRGGFGRGFDRGRDFRGRDFGGRDFRGGFNGRSGFAGRNGSGFRGSTGGNFRGSTGGGFRGSTGGGFRSGGGGSFHGGGGGASRSGGGGHGGGGHR